LKQDLSDEAFNNLIDRASHIESDLLRTNSSRQRLTTACLEQCQNHQYLPCGHQYWVRHYITEVLTDARSESKVRRRDLKEAYRAAAKKSNQKPIMQGDESHLSKWAVSCK